LFGIIKESKRNDSKEKESIFAWAQHNSFFAFWLLFQTMEQMIFHPLSLPSLSFLPSSFT
jgi:hypothetical protein